MKRLLSLLLVLAMVLSMVPAVFAQEWEGEIDPADPVEPEIETVVIDDITAYTSVTMVADGNAVCKYVWTAAEDGLLSGIYPSWAYIYDENGEMVGEATVSMTITKNGEEIGQFDDTAITAGDVIEIVPVVTYEDATVEVTFDLYGFFKGPEGSMGNPYELYNNSFEPADQSVTTAEIAAGATAYFTAYGFDGYTIQYGDVSEAIMNSGMRGYNFAITNNGEAAATYTINFIAPALGTEGNAEILEELGDITTALGASTGTYFYKWYAPYAAGTLTVAAPYDMIEAGYDVSVSFATGMDTSVEYLVSEATEFTDDGDPVLNIALAGGNEITFKVSAPVVTDEQGNWVIDENQNLQYISGDFTFSASYAEVTYSITLPEGEGYTVTAAPMSEGLAMNDTVVLTFALEEGYTKGENFAFNLNGNPVELDENNQYSFEVYGDYTVTVEGVEKKIVKFDLSGSTMTMGNSLAINFVINTSLLDGDGHYAVITKSYADGTDDVTVTVPQTEWKQYGTSATLYYFTFNGVKAKEMTDQFVVNVYNSKGQEVTNEKIESVRDYAMRALGNEEKKASPDPEKLALYVDMMNYGAAAQTFFSEYHGNDLANSQLSDTQKAYATGDVVMENNSSKGTGCAGATLGLTNEIVLNFVYNNDVLANAAYAEATFTHHEGSDAVIRIEKDDMFAYGTSTTLSVIAVSGMKIADYKQIVTLNVYDADGNVISTSVDSVESYASRTTNNKYLYDAIIKFGVAAYNTFH